MQGRGISKETTIISTIVEDGSMVPLTQEKRVDVDGSEHTGPGTVFGGKLDTLRNRAQARKQRMQEEALMKEYGTQNLHGLT